MFKSRYKTVENIIGDCKADNLLVGPGGVDIIRLVTHMDISSEDVQKAAAIIAEVLEE